MPPTTKKSKPKLQQNSIQNHENSSKLQNSKRRKRDTSEADLTSSVEDLEVEAKRKVKSTQMSIEQESDISSDVSSISSNNLDAPIMPPASYKKLGKGPPSVPSTGKKYIGCHVSAAGGIWNCFDNGLRSRAKSIGLFVRNHRSWNAKPLDMISIQNWNVAKKDFPSHLILPHGSYLMNLGSPKEETLKKSRDLLVEELSRCDKLGIPQFNFHPGSTLGEISRRDCCEVVAESINLAHKKTKNVICVIENMCKQGHTVGGDFNEIRHIIMNIKDKKRVGVCLDTCHSHAAGYDLSTEDGFKSLLNDFEKIIGWQFLRGLHINDSKGKVGDHKDRHENIGKGTIGIEGFRRIMNCPHFNDLPLILETPVADEKTYAKEIAILEGLIQK